MDLVYYARDGISWSAINCPNCDHRTSPTDTCPVCQPSPTFARCATCEARGPIPTTTTITPSIPNDAPDLPTMTIAPGPINEPPTWPTMTMTMTGTNDAPAAIKNDELLRIAKSNPPPAAWQQDDSTDPTT